MEHITCAQVVGVPRLLMAHRHIRRVVITLTHIDETVVQFQVTPLGMADERAAVPGYVSNLPLVSPTLACVGGIGVVLRALIGVTQVGIEQYLLGQLERHAHRGIDTAYLDRADVHHRPAIEARALGDGENLVGNLVVVAIDGEFDSTEGTMLGEELVLRTHVILRGIFRAQVAVADIGVIEVIERGHAEDAFVKSTHVQVML